MLRSLFALLVVAVVGTSQGCRICDSPYDYCGPVMPCGEGCGAGGCGHSGYDGGGYSGGGDGGCATCGNGGGHGGHAVEHEHEYEGGTVIQGQPTPAPTPAPMTTPQQGRRAAPKTMSKATYEAPLQSVRTQSYAATRPAKQGSPYSVNQAPRNASKTSGPIFW
jgi:hypothetical protein